MNRAILRYPRAGSTARVPVYPEPERVEDMGEGVPESDESFSERTTEWRARRHIEIEVERIGHEQRATWRFRRAQLLAEDAARLKNDEILAAYGATEEGLRAQAQLNRDILAGCLIAIHGVAIDGVPAEMMRATRADDRPALIDLLEEVDLMGVCGAAALRAQTPTPSQGEN